MRDHRPLVFSLHPVFPLHYSQATRQSGTAKLERDKNGFTDFRDGNPSTSMPDSCVSVFIRVVVADLVVERHDWNCHVAHVLDPDESVLFIALDDPGRSEIFGTTAGDVSCDPLRSG